MNISGSIGYTLLKHKYYNKYVLLLADVHDGVEYCKQDSIMIDDFLKLKDNNDILLEEAVREQLDLSDLWPSSLHTGKLKKLNKEDLKIKPIDIRPLLLPFSWELYGYQNSKIPNMTLLEYLKLINDFFSLNNNKLMRDYIVPEVKKLDQSKQFKITVMSHFNELRDIYKDLIKDAKEYLDMDMIKVYKTNQDLLEKINNLISMIMEWYIILLITNSTNNTIIHAGLAHSNRLLDLLIQVFQFNLLKSFGVNTMNEINNEMKSCISIPNNINKIF
jgi:hypothetical protein